MERLGLCRRHLPGGRMDDCAHPPPTTKQSTIRTRTLPFDSGEEGSTLFVSFWRRAPFASPAACPLSAAARTPSLGNVHSEPVLSRDVFVLVGRRGGLRVARCEERAGALRQQLCGQLHLRRLFLAFGRFSGQFTRLQRAAATAQPSACRIAPGRRARLECLPGRARAALGATAAHLMAATAA